MTARAYLQPAVIIEQILLQQERRATLKAWRIERCIKDGLEWHNRPRSWLGNLLKGPRHATREQVVEILETRSCGEFWSPLAAVRARFTENDGRLAHLLQLARLAEAEGAPLELDDDTIAELYRRVPTPPDD